MSTQVAEHELSETTVPSPRTLAVAAPPACDAILDRATMERVRVAEAAADTLEGLGESRAWSRLDPAVASHLLAHAHRLCEYLGRVQGAPGLRSDEATVLRLRRIQRRLQIAADHVEGPKKQGQGQGKAQASPEIALYLGDFTEDEATAETTPRRSAAPGSAKKGAKRMSVARIGLAQRRALAAVHKRLFVYVALGIAVIGASLAWRLSATVKEKRVVATPPPITFTPGAFMEDVQAFMPVTSTALRDNTLTIVAADEWFERAEGRRREDAAGVHVFVANRNVKRLMIQRADGHPIVRYENGLEAWVEEVPLSIQAAGTPAPQP